MSQTQSERKPTKDAKKETTGRGFLRVMRHPVDSIGDAVGDSKSRWQADKENKAQYKLALEEVSDWHKDGNNSLGWLEGDFKKFEVRFNEAKAAKKDKKRGITVATDLLSQAWDIGNEANDATKQRGKINGALASVIKAIGLTDNAEALAEVNSIFKEMDDPQTAPELAALLDRAKTLSTKMADVGGAERVSNKRLVLELKLNASIRDAAGDISTALNRKFGAKKTPGVSQTYVELTLVKRTRDIVDGLEAENDDPKWTTTDERLLGLEEHYTTAVAELNKEIAKFRKEMDGDKGKALYESGAAEQRKFDDAGTRDAAKATFDAACEKLEAALGPLLDRGTPEGGKLADRIKAEKEGIIAANYYDISSDWIEASLKEVNQTILAADASLNPEVTALDEEIDTLLSALKKRRKAAGLLDKSYGVLSKEAQQIRPMLQTNNAGALVSARQLIDGITQAGLDPATQTIAAFVGTAGQIKAIAEDKTVSKEFADEAGSLTKAVETIVKAVDLHALPTSAYSLAAVKKQADDLKAKTTELEHWRVGAKAQLDLLEHSIDEVEKAIGGKKGIIQIVHDVVGTSDIYGKTVFGQDYKTVHEGYDKPGVDHESMQTMLFAAQAAVSDLLRKIKAGDKTGATKDLETSKVDATKREADEQKKQAAIEAEQAAITKDYDDMVETLRNTRKEVADHAYGDKEELEELEILRNQVRKKLKNKDFDGAKEQLTGTNGLKPRVEKLKGAPGGVTTDSLNELKKAIEELWGNAKSKVSESLKNVQTLAEPIADRLAIDKAAISGRMSELEKKLFDFNFGVPVRVLLDTNRDIKSRKVAREDALKLVRDARAVLMANPVAESIRNNPFGVSAGFTDYRAFLDSVEYNALRAVPPK